MTVMIINIQLIISDYRIVARHMAHFPTLTDLPCFLATTWLKFGTKMDQSIELSAVLSGKNVKKYFYYGLFGFGLSHPKSP